MFRLHGAGNAVKAPIHAFKQPPFTRDREVLARLSVDLLHS